MHPLESLKKCLSNSSTLNTFSVIHTLFGKYSIQSNSKLISFLTMMYCVVVGTILVVLRILQGITGGKVVSLQVSVILCLEFLIHIILYLYDKNKKILSYCSEIKNIYTKLGLPENPLVPKAWKYYMLRAIIFKGAILITLYFIITTHGRYFTLVFVTVSNHMTYDYQMLIFYSLFENIKLLKEKFVKDLKDSVDNGQNRIDIKVIKLHKNLEIHENLVDSFDGFGLHLQISVSNKIKIFWLK